MQPAKAAVEGRTLVGESQRTVGARAMVKEVSARCSQPDGAQAGAPGVVALWFNRGTGPKPEIQCFLGLYLRFCEIVDKTKISIF